MRRYVPSYLTRRGRGFYPGFFRFLSDVSVPLADDKISNEKLVQFDQIFLRKCSTEMRIVVAWNYSEHTKYVRFTVSVLVLYT